MAPSLYERGKGPLLSAVVLTLFLISGSPAPHSLCPAPANPLYITVTEISHNAKDKILEISCKIFTNDLETVLEKGAKTKVDLSGAANKAATDKLIDEYVERHLRLKEDGKVAGLHFVGSEKEADGARSQFPVNDLPAEERMQVVH